MNRWVRSIKRFVQLIASAVAGCILISSFASLVGIFTWITSSAKESKSVL